MSVSAGQRRNQTERRRLETRERLYQAAVELIAERGFEATTMTDIAERADVGRQTAFNHFPSKGDFTVEWTRRRRTRAAEAVGRNTPTDADAIERLRAYFHELALISRQPSSGPGSGGERKRRGESPRVSWPPYWSMRTARLP